MTDEEYSYMVLYDVGDSASFDKKLFLNQKIHLFDSIEDAYNDIVQFIHKYNYLMSYINKDLIYEYLKSEDDCKTILDKEEYILVGQTKNKSLFVCIKKIYL